MKFGIIVLFLLFCAVVPLIFIWALNALVPTLGIPFTFETYCAAWTLISILQISTTTTK